MPTYRLAHSLGAGAVVETYLGEAETRPLLVHRLVPPWSGEASAFALQFGKRADEWRSSFSGGISALVDWGLAKETVWIVEEHHDGETLRSVLTSLARQQLQLRPNEGLTVLMRVLSTLVELHAQGMVHGDVCASTVLLTPTGEVKLTGFGISRSAGTMPSLGPARTERECLTPEQLEGAFDMTGDVFRVGLLLHELSVGRQLFAGTNPLTNARAYSTPGSMPAVPAPFVALIVRLLGKDPGHRPNSSEAMKALDQLVRTFKFSTTNSEVATLFGRAFPQRRPVRVSDFPGGETLILGSPESLPARAPAETPAAPELTVTVSPRPVGAPVRIAPRSSGAQPTASPAAPLPLGAPKGPFADLSAMGAAGVPAIAPLVAPLVSGGLLPSPSPPGTARSTRASPGGSYLSVAPPSGPTTEVLGRGPGGTAARRPAPVPSPPVGAVDASGAVNLGRIVTRRVTKSELAATKAAETVAEQRGMLPVSQPGDPSDAALGAHLVERGQLQPEGLSEALAFARSAGGFLSDALIALELVDEELLITTMSELTRTTAILPARLDALQPGPEALALVPVAHAIQLCVVPLTLKGASQLVVAMRDPMDEAVINRLKEVTNVSSVVGMRTSERAIRRTIARCYPGANGLELPSWVEQGGSSPLTPAGGPAPSSRSSVFELTTNASYDFEEGGSTLEEGAPKPLKSTKEAPRLSEATARLFAALLARDGGGREGLKLLAMASAVGERVGLSAEELDQLRFATAAVVVANLSEGRQPGEQPTSVALSKVLGQSFGAIQPLVVPLLEGCTRPVEDRTAGALAAIFLVTDAAGGTRPHAPEAVATLEALRGRACIPLPVLEALQRELAA